MYLSFTLWHFPTFSIVLPSRTITFMYGIGCTNNLSFLTTLMSRKLWVLSISISTVTFSFFIFPFSLSVCGWIILAMVFRDILGVSSTLITIFWVSSSSFFDSSSSYPLFSSSMQVNRFFELSPEQDLYLASHLSLHRLHFPSFIH